MQTINKLFFIKSTLVLTFTASNISLICSRLKLTNFYKKQSICNTYKNQKEGLINKSNNFILINTSPRKYTFTPNINSLYKIQKALFHSKPEHIIIEQQLQQCESDIQMIISKELKIKHLSFQQVGSKHYELILSIEANKPSYIDEPTTYNNYNLFFNRTYSLNNSIKYMINQENKRFMINKHIGFLKDFYKSKLNQYDLYTEQIDMSTLRFVFSRIL